MNKRNVVMITGGLGNQLFQLAFALSKSRGSRFYIETRIGRPRTSITGIPEVANFQLPNNVTFLENKESKFIRKLFGYTLRSRISPNKVEKLAVYLPTAKRITEAFLSLYFRRSLKLVTPRTVGYEDLDVSKRRGNIFVGYFQSHKWALEAETYSQLMQLYIANPSPELRELQQNSINGKPLVVHIRLGDYKSEASFGILGKEYYKNAIEELMRDGHCKDIWVFSDEPELAKSYFPEEFRGITKWITSTQDSASETLEAMRLGYGYVIGNSTFSWWGALLTHNPGVKVIAPKPWFRSMETPKDLIPSAWEQKTAMHTKN
jgi:hypothetical protein